MDDTEVVADVAMETLGRPLADFDGVVWNPLSGGGRSGDHITAHEKSLIWTGFSGGGDGIRSVCRLRLIINVGLHVFEGPQIRV